MIDYSSEIIRVKILGKSYNIHESVIKNCLVTGSVSSEFSDVHDYTLSFIESDDELANHIVRCIYCERFVSKSPETDIHVYEFIDKYCDKTKIYINLPRIDEINEHVKLYKEMMTLESVIKFKQDKFLLNCHNRINKILGYYPIKDTSEFASGGNRVKMSCLFISLDFCGADIIKLFCETYNLTEAEEMVLIRPQELHLLMPHKATKLHL